MNASGVSVREVAPPVGPGENRSQAERHIIHSEQFGLKEGTEANRGGEQMWAGLRTEKRAAPRTRTFHSANMWQPASERLQVGSVHVCVTRLLWTGRLSERVSPGVLYVASSLWRLVAVLLRSLYRCFCHLGRLYRIRYRFSVCSRLPHGDTFNAPLRYATREYSVTICRPVVTYRFSLNVKDLCVFAL